MAGTGIAAGVGGGGWLAAIIAAIVGVIVAGLAAFGLVSVGSPGNPTVDAPLVVYGTR